MSIVQQNFNNNKITIDLASVLDRSQKLLLINEKYLDNLINLYITNSFFLNMSKLIVEYHENNKVDDKFIQFIEDLDFVTILKNQIDYVFNEVFDMKSIINKINISLQKISLMNLENKIFIEQVNKELKNVNIFYEKVTKILTLLEIIKNSSDKINQLGQKNLEDIVVELKNIVIMVFQLGNIIYKRKPLL